MTFVLRLLFFPAKDKLFNDIVSDMKQNAVKFPGMMADMDVRNYVQILVNAMWYLDGCKETIQRRSATLPGSVTRIPER